VIHIDDLEDFDPEQRFVPEQEFNPEQEFAETFNQAVYFVEIERYDEAEKKFRALIAADRHLSDSHYYLGKIHVAQGNFTQAVIVLTLAIKHRPDNALAYRLRSHVFTMLGESQRATADKKKADELAPPKETGDVTPSPSVDR
jgi:tetratricopeptide (TPR) repeat protein